ncbi:MAG: DUF2491 family protein [Stappiaceae bacterium]
MFGRWRKNKEDAELPQILDVTIDRAVNIDPMAVKLWPADSLLAERPTTLMVVAQGHCDLGEDSHLHRFYKDDDTAMLQIQGGDGQKDMRVDEIMLWEYFDVQYPTSETDWKKTKEAIRQTQFVLQSENEPITFDRVWFDSSNSPEDPMTYWETVHSRRDKSAARKIFQTAMLFGRTLSDGEDEMLLVNMEEPEESERSVAYMVGRSLAQHNLEV